MKKVSGRFHIVPHYVSGFQLNKIGCFSKHVYEILTKEETIMSCKVSISVNLDVYSPTSLLLTKRWLSVSYDVQVIIRIEYCFSPYQSKMDLQSI